MSSLVPSDFLADHLLLSQWQDDLEHLCYMLIQICSPEVLQEKKWPCHQAAELGPLTQKLLHLCEDKTSRLSSLVRHVNRQEFVKHLRSIPQIRHAAVHRECQTQASMETKARLVHDTTADLQKLISAASTSSLSELDWYPVTCASWEMSTSPRFHAMAVKVNEPLLSGRKKCIEEFEKWLRNKKVLEARAAALRKTQQNSEKNEEKRRAAEKRRRENKRRQDEFFEEARDRRRRKQEEHRRRQIETHGSKVDDLVGRLRQDGVEYQVVKIRRQMQSSSPEKDQVIPVIFLFVVLGAPFLTLFILLVRLVRLFRVWV